MVANAFSSVLDDVLFIHGECFGSQKETQKGRSSFFNICDSNNFREELDGCHCMHICLEVLCLIPHTNFQFDFSFNFRLWPFKFIRGQWSCLVSVADMMAFAVFHSLNGGTTVAIASPWPGMTECLDFFGGGHILMVIMSQDPVLIAKCSSIARTQKPLGTQNFG